MGNLKSTPRKAEGQTDGFATVPPNVEFMIGIYGKEASDQFTVWLQEWGFPE